MDEKQKDYLDNDSQDLDEVVENNIVNDTNNAIDSNDSNDVCEPVQSSSIDVESTIDTNDDEWKFDANAPTLDNSIQLDNEYDLEIDNSNSNDNDKTDLDDSQHNDLLEQVEADNDIAKSKTIKTILVSVLIALIVVGIVFLGVKYYTTPNANEKMNPGNVAVTIGKTPVSIGLYNYCYNGTVNRILQTHGAELKPDVPFSKQTLLNSDGNMVNAEQYFKDETLQYLQSMVACYEEGIKEGIVLTEQQKAEINSQIAKVKDEAQKADEGINEYTQKRFGEFCGLATYQKYLEQQVIASEYKNQMLTKLNYTNEECDNYFNDNLKDYQELPMAFLLIPYNDEEEGSKDKVIEDAKEYCETITDVDALIKYVPVIYKDLIDKNVEMGHYEDVQEATQAFEKMVEAKITMQSKDFNNDVKEWLFNEETQINQCNYFVDDIYKCVFLVLKTGEPELNEGYNEKVYSVRHILVKPKHTDENSTEKEFTDEEWENAKTEAQNIYDQFKETEMNELDFAKLSEEFSEDVESTSNGRSGLYGGIIENCKLGMTVPDFENWCIDDVRKYGDTGIVKTQFGYHIIFFKNYETVSRAIARKEMAFEKAEDNIKAYSIKEHKGAMEKTKVAKISDYQ